MEVEKELNAAQIGCCPVMYARNMLEEEHYNVREPRVPALDRQSGVPIRVGAVILNLSLTPGSVWRGVPAIGDDTTDIMTRLSGFSNDEIQEYQAGGIIQRTGACEQPACDFFWT